MIFPSEDRASGDQSWGPACEGLDLAGLRFRSQVGRQWSTQETGRRRSKARAWGGGCRSYSPFSGCCGWTSLAAHNFERPLTVAGATGKGVRTPMMARYTVVYDRAADRVRCGAFSRWTSSRSGRRTHKSTVWFGGQSARSGLRSAVSCFYRIVIEKRKQNDVTRNVQSVIMILNKIINK